MSTREALMEKIKKQPDWVLEEVSVFIDELTAKTAHQPPPTPSGRGWPPGYFEKTWGAFANEPFERPPQLPFEKREEW